jgi:hypothetical protein
MAVVAVASLLISGLPATAKATTDIETTTTLVSYTSLTYPDSIATYVARVSPVPIPPAFVMFEYSTDGGSVWASTSMAQVDEQGDANGGIFTPAQDAKGVRLIRARFMGSTGYAESMSSPAEQTVAAYVTEITSFVAMNPNGGQILPAVPIKLDLHAINPSQTYVFEIETPDGWEKLADGGAFLQFNTDHHAFLTIDPLGLGSHHVRVRMDETDYVTGAVGDLSIEIAKGIPILTWAVEPTNQAHHQITGTVALETPAGGASPGGEITVRRTDTDAVIGSGPAPGPVGYSAPGVEAGTFAVKASYEGDANFAAATSSHDVPVLADIVDASAIRLSQTTFYPYKDGYRDTVSISGSRNEPIAVAIRIYSPAGKLVKSVAIPSGIGAYSYAWNGRTSSGAIRASGKYKVVQTLTDGAGTRKSVSAYVNLSSKRLYSYSTYINKTLSQAARKTSSWVGWEFYLPAATVYKGLSFQVYAKSSLIPGLEVGGYDFRSCGRTSSWSPACVSSWRGVGHTTAWYGKGLSVSYNRSGRYVRGIVSAAGSGVVYKARLKVSYAILR